MEGLYLLLLLLSHWITSSAATTISTVFKAPGKSSTTFAVGRNKTAILAIKSPSGPNFNFTFSAKGKVINSDNCDNCYQKSVWVPFFMITDRIGYSEYGNTFYIPQDVGPLDEIDLSVESKEEMEWQIFTLPLEKDIITPIIISVVVVVLLLLLAASYFCYRCFLKKKNNNNKPRSEGNATVTREWTSTAGFSRRGVHPSLNRQDSPHVSENSLYSVPTDAHAGFDRIPSSRDSENSLYAVPTFVQPGLTRQNSSHDSENSLYDVPEVAHPGLAR
ncbi:uncharacterized protein [Palaemon carinicauda]|uniref:uncharacterized protein n=1 Tax=Palaemon carinicauda TaxID=392227 RepID=UPI0035B65767